jgi:hypothetical protein
MSLTALCSRACDPSLDGCAAAAPVVIDFDLKLDAREHSNPRISTSRAAYRLWGAIGMITCVSWVLLPVPRSGVLARSRT